LTLSRLGFVLVFGGDSGLVVLGEKLVCFVKTSGVLADMFG